MKKLKLGWLDFLAQINATKRLRRNVCQLGMSCDDTELFKTKHAALIVSIYAEAYGLSGEGWKLVLGLPNAKDILLKHVRKGREGQLPIPVELKIFANPEMAEVVREYVRYQRISIEAEAAMLDLPNAKELTLLHLKNQGFIYSVAKREAPNEKKLIEKVADAEVMDVYARREPLDDETMLEMLDGPKAFELACAYAKHRPLCNEAQIKLMSVFSPQQILEWLKINNFELCEEALGAMYNHQAHFVELIFEYAKKNQLPAGIEELLLHMPDAEEHVRRYVQEWPLQPENEPLLFKLPHKAGVLTSYIQEYGASEILLDELFADPDMAYILLTVVKKQRLSPKHQVLLFSEPNAAELLKAYIEHDELCKEAQLKMLEMPKRDTAGILRTYAEEYTLSEYLLQRLNVEAYLLQFVF